MLAEIFEIPQFISPHAPTIKDLLLNKLKYRPNAVVQAHLEPQGLRLVFNLYPVSLELHHQPGRHGQFRLDVEPRIHQVIQRTHFMTWPHFSEGALRHHIRFILREMEVVDFENWFSIQEEV